MGKNSSPRSKVTLCTACGKRVNWEVVSHSMRTLKRFAWHPVDVDTRQVHECVVLSKVKIYSDEEKREFAERRSRGEV